MGLAGISFIQEHNKGMQQQQSLWARCSHRALSSAAALEGQP